MDYREGLVIGFGAGLLLALVALLAGAVRVVPS